MEVGLRVSDYSSEDYLTDSESDSEFKYLNPIFGAIGFNDTQEICKRIAQEPACVNARDPIEEKTPLHWAVINGQYNIAEMLIEHGASLNLVDQNRWTPFDYAANDENLSLIQILIKNGALPNMNTEHILPSPIHYASGILEFTDCLEKVFQQFSDVNLLDHKGKTPLLWAAELGNHMATKLLLQKNANVNARNKKGETPLHLAVKKGFPLITQILISNRADCNAKDKRGKAPMHLAAENGDAVSLEILLGAGAKLREKDDFERTPLHDAANHGRLEAVSFFASQNILLEDVDKNNDTPLHLAASEGHVCVVAKLIESGVDIETYNKQLQTPLFTAVKKENFDVASLLLQKGASTEVFNEEGDTLLHLCAKMKWGAGKFIDLLMSHAIDLDKKDFEEKRALHVASLNDHERTVHRLLLAEITYLPNIDQREICVQAAIERLKILHNEHEIKSEFLDPFIRFMDKLVEKKIESISPENLANMLNLSIPK